jgi:hypothetical protein
MGLGIAGGQRRGTRSVVHSPHFWTSGSPIATHPPARTSAATRTAQAGRDIDPWMGSGSWVGRLGGYSFESSSQWVRDGGETLKKNNHTTMWDWKKKQRPIASLFEPITSQKKDLVIRKNKHIGDICKNNMIASQSDQNARTCQLRNLEFAICKFVTKAHI